LVILYADFSCPYSYALCERLAPSSSGVDWRGVRRRPDPGGLGREVAEVHELAPEVPLSLPATLPDSGPAISAAAAAYRLDPDAAADFRIRIYRALWVNGRDISDRAVLEDLARSSLLPPEVADGAPEVVAQWRLAWDAAGAGVLPALVREDGRVVRGLAAAESLLRP
jgi:predicted DsbA family dithiol-disulfide isomerase